MSHSTQPTMKDVAREAGVALGTVSRVFNGYPVGEEYRERVEAAAEKLTYRPRPENKQDLLCRAADAVSAASLFCRADR